MSGPIIEFDRVTIRYPDAARATLQEVSFGVDEGELCLVVGRTGAGKSTLLGAVNGLVPHFTGGSLAGRVTVAGRDTATHPPRELADVVGVVGQNPLAGFVTDTVEEELAYGMEQLAVPPAVMRKRVEEVLDVLGLAELRGAALHELSGGQQQRVAIGAVLTANPKVLVLDEPTSALDPTAAEDVLATITRLVHDLAVTVLLAEHRLERVVQYADRVLHLAGDGSVESGAPVDVFDHASVAPPVVELGRLAGWSPLPLSVRDARRRADDLRARLTVVPPARRTSGRPTTALQVKRITVRYDTFVAVDNVDLELRDGEVTALMGRNGSGKSSLLWALLDSGPRIALVPQTPSDLLFLDTVAQELARADADAAAGANAADADAATSARILLDELAPGVPDDSHPRDLSEGQQLALVLAIQLRTGPRVVLLDEPTRGLDYPAKHALSAIVDRLVAAGRSVLIATHDVEFVAGAADRVVVLADGEIVADGPTAQIVGGSPAFAPQVSKILAPTDVLTVGQVAAALGADGVVPA